MITKSIDSFRGQFRNAYLLIKEDFSYMYIRFDTVYVIKNEADYYELKKKREKTLLFGENVLNETMPPLRQRTGRALILPSGPCPPARGAW